MSSYSRQQLEAWLKGIRAHGNVLDVGGSQNPVGSRLGGMEPETRFTILDLERPHEVKRAADIMCDLNLPFDTSEWVRNAPKYNKRDESQIAWAFDQAFCLEVSEYWWNPYQALKNIHMLLKKDATLYISFQFLYPVHKPTEQDFLRYTDFGAVKLLHEAGFNLVDISYRRTVAAHIVPFYSAEGMKMAPGYVDHEVVGSLITAKAK